MRESKKRVVDLGIVPDELNSVPRIDGATAKVTLLNTHGNKSKNRNEEMVGDQGWQRQRFLAKT